MIRFSFLKKKKTTSCLPGRKANVYSPHSEQAGRQRLVSARLELNFMKHRANGDSQLYES